MTGPDQVSWLVIDRGWKVLSADGEEVGTVDEVLGDRNADIFDGLAVKTSLLGAPRYVEAERIARIEPGRVELELAREDVERLPEYEPAAPQEAILPERSSLLDRITGWFRGR
jgi:hypothetical protein